jgi:HTH-type transcriptional regulator, competence development regulator
MPQTLGQVLKDARNKSGRSLRQVEEMTGIHNAHLSQIENDTITKPDLSMLFELAVAYDLDYQDLLRRAGRNAGAETSARERQRKTAAMRAMGELSAKDQNQVLSFMAELRSKKRRD